MPQLQFHQMENRLHLFYPPVSNLTIFNGKPDIPMLKQRCTEIIEKNPWLCGKLRVGIRGLYLSYFTKKLSTDKYFSVVKCPDIVNYNHQKMRKYFKEKVAKTRAGDVSIILGKQLFHLAVVLIDDENFALYLNVAHVLADGNTFHALHRMIDPEVQLISLKVERVMDYPELLKKAVGGPDRDFAMSITMIVSGLKRRLLTRPQSALYQIDDDKIKKAKAEFREGDQFVSTNDILTAFIFRVLQYEHLLMYLDCREKLDRVESTHAGNYIFTQYFSRVDGKSPIDIRKRVTSLHPSHSLPITHHLRDRVGVTTSWVKFYNSMQLPGCETLAMYPTMTQNITDCLVTIFKRDDKTICINMESSRSSISKLDAAIEEIGVKIS